MGRLIDESLLQEKLALIPMEERTFRRTVEELENAPTVDAIPKADYENRLKVDMAAILDQIRAEIEQLPTSTCAETHRIRIDADDFKENVLEIFNKYKVESEDN